MSRKSTIITLGVLGAVAAAGLGACCCGGLFSPDEKQEDAIAHEHEKDKNGGHHVAHRPHRPGFFPLFFGLGRGVSHPIGPSGHPTGGAPSGAPRGGFGATGAHGGRGAAHGVGA